MHQHCHFDVKYTGFIFSYSSDGNCISIFSHSVQTRLGTILLFQDYDRTLWGRWASEGLHFRDIRCKCCADFLGTWSGLFLEGEGEGDEMAVKDGDTITVYRYLN